MMQTTINNPAAWFIALLLLLAFKFVLDQLGLFAWLAWLERREHKRGNEAANKYWRTHQ